MTAVEFLPLFFYEENMKKIIIAVVIIICFGILCLLIPIEKKREFYQQWGVLAEFSETDERAEYIIEHYDEFPELLISRFYSADDEKKEQELDFLYNYAFSKDNYKNMSFTDEELNCTEIPDLYMADKRWGYEEFEGGFIKTDGCVAVSLTMANLYLRHNGEVDPVKVAHKAEEIDNIGTFGAISNEKMVELCEAVGLNVIEYNYSPKSDNSGNADLNVILNAISENHVLMLGMAGETFGSHAVVVKSCNENGEMILNDPARPENKEKIWNFDDIKSEMYFIWELY